MKNARRISLAALPLAALFWSCSDDGSGSGADAGADGAADLDTDVDTDADTDTDTDTDTEPTVLTLLEIQPEAASREEETELTLIGALFDEGMTVTVFEDVTSTTVILGIAAVEAGGTSAVVTLPADSGRPQGYYDVTVANPDGETDTLEDGLFVSALTSPKVTEVEPPLAWTGVSTDETVSDRRVQIKGQGFVNTPWVTWVSATDPDSSFDAVEVHFIDAETLEAVVPSESAEMPAGDYHVWVTNPDKLSGQWIEESTSAPGIFIVTATPPPMIEEIDPVQWPFMDTLSPFTVKGQYFQDGAEIAFVTASGDESLGSVTFVDSGELTAVISGGTFSVGLYPVRVTNPDGQWDIFYIFEAKNGTDGHFDEQSFEVIEESPMTVGRERLGLEFGFDDFGGTHIYASGGVDSDGTVRGDVESASVNIYGEVGSWRVEKQWLSAAEPRVDNAHGTARQGHRVVRAGDRLFAIGGCASDTHNVQNDSTTALDTVESAQILGLDTRPIPAAPAPTSGGDLPVGTWYYRVSALGSWGESLASKEVQILNEGGAFTIQWTPVDGAQKYNVYRCPASDGRPSSARLLASEVSGVSFTDDGSIHPAPGFVSGTADTSGSLAEGVWTYRLTAVVGSEESVAGYRTAVELGAGEGGVTLSWQEVPGATYNVYRTVGPSGEEETYLLADGIAQTAWTDDGGAAPDEGSPAPDGTAVLPPGTLGRWTELEGTLNTAREGAGAVAMAIPSGDEDVDDKTYIYVAGGRPHAGGDGYLTTVEKALVIENGDLGPWEIETEELNNERAFFPLLTSQSRDETEIPDIPDDSDDPDDSDGPVEKWWEPRSIDDEPLFLFALQGDDSFDPPQNSGLTTMEAALVTSPDGVLEAWYEQAATVPAGRRTYAHDGVIVDDFLYCFPGVDTEQASGEPNPLISNTSRFPLNIPPEADDELIDPFMAANASFEEARSYYDTVRVCAHVYLVGGNDGDGPTASVESIPQ